MAELSAWRWRVWSASICGASHRRAKLPCQDAATQVWSELRPRGPVVLAVADGHGSDGSFRSDVGAQYAVRLAVDEIGQRFADEIRGANHSQIKQWAEQRIPTVLVTQWQSEVARHWNDNPPTKSECERWTAARHLVARDNDVTADEIRRVYGSTLAVILADETYALFWQLGDGDFLAVTDDAAGNLSVSRPIARDAALIANETTSLCQPDAAAKFQVRICVFSERPPVLLFACTDGYSNGFETPEGFEQVGPDLCQALRQDGFDAISAELPGELERVSASGSGDDVTAGFIFREDVPR